MNKGTKVSCKAVKFFLKRVFTFLENIYTLPLANVNSKRKAIFSSSNYRFMKYSIIIVSVFLLFSCSSNKKSNPGNSSLYVDTSKYVIDTTITGVNIDEKMFTFYVLKTKQNGTNEDPESMSYVGLVIIDETEKSLAFIDTTFNLFASDRYNLFKGNNAPLNSKGRLFFTQFSSGGGSGYIKDLFTIDNKNGKINLSKIIRTGELSFYSVSDNGESILLLSGIWNMNDESETHFSDHKFDIKYYYATKYGYDLQYQTTTSLKYANVDAEKNFKDIATDIIKNEPGLFTIIKIEDFKLLRDLKISPNNKNIENTYASSNSNNTSSTNAPVSFDDDQSVYIYLSGKTFYSANRSARVSIDNVVHINGEDAYFNLTIRKLSSSVGVVKGQSMNNPDGTITIYVYPQRGCITNTGDEFCISK